MTVEEKLRPKVQTSRVTDMVALLPHNTIPNYQNMHVREYQGERHAGKIYTVENTGTDNVKMLGNEVSAGEQREFVIAVVNKKTGSVEYRPTKLYTFSTEYHSDMALRLGEKRKNPTNFTSEHATKSGEFFEKRSGLTEVFGGAKKKKMLANMDKRRVEDDTMNELNKTAFSSTSVVTEEKKDLKESDITLLQERALSAVLPPFVDAEMAKDVYPLSLFISEEEIEQFGEGCVEHLKKTYAEFDPSEERLENSFPEMYKQYLGGRLTNPRQATLACLAVGMVYLAKLSRRRVPRIAMENAPVPQSIVQFVRTKFLPGEITRRGPSWGLDVNRLDHDKLVAHTLAFALTTDPGMTIYTDKWMKYLGFPSGQVEKLLVALGAIKRSLPQDQWRNGRHVHTLIGPPKEMKKSKTIRR